MAKVKYTYDSKTLSYRKIERTWKQKLQDIAVFGAVTMAFGVVFYLAADLWFESPKERRMKRELENMVLQYELMNGKLDLNRSKDLLQPNRSYFMRLTLQ